MRHRSGPVGLCEKMLEFIKCATGPDLWNYVKNARIYQMRHRSGPVELCEKILNFSNGHRSGPVELCEKMLEFIKYATGPDLWNYVKKC